MKRGEGGFLKNKGRKTDLHHLYPKGCRKEGMETNRVNKIDHRCWHILCRDSSPKEAQQRIYAVFCQKLVLSSLEKGAREHLLCGRTEEEAFRYCAENFLPDGYRTFPGEKPLSRSYFLILNLLI